MPGWRKKVGSTWWFRFCTVDLTVGIKKDGKFACLKTHRISVACFVNRCTVVNNVFSFRLRRKKSLLSKPEN